MDTWALKKVVDSAVSTVVRGFNNDVNKKVIMKVRKTFYLEEEIVQWLNAERSKDDGSASWWLNRLLKRLMNGNTSPRS